MKTKLIAEWKIKVRDKEGRLLREICKDGDLVVLNWLKFASAFGLVCYNTSSLSLVREDGSTKTYPVNIWHLVFYNPSGMKIAVGSDSTPPSLSDYKLGNKWGDSGSISYSVSQISDTEWQLSIANTFSTSQERVLNELGLFYEEGPNTGKWYLLCRDVLPEPITIPAGASVTITYTLKSRSGG
jgi:hypothetical protein